MEDSLDCRADDAAQPPPQSDAAPNAGALPVGVDDAVLTSLLAALSSVRGIVDVQITLVGAPVFHVLIDGPLPDALPVVDAPYPLVPVSVASAGTSEAPAGQDPPLVPGSCVGYRPGRSFSGCTWAWFAAGSDGKTYASTAGHCVGAVGSDAGALGRVAFRIEAGIGADFALVEVYPNLVVSVNPSMCHWGGATGEAASGGVGKIVRQYGWGLGFSTLAATRARSGVLYAYGTTSFTYIGPMMPGDSGSPVRLDDGPALGVHTHGIGVVVSTPTLKYGTRLSHGFALAEAELGIDLSLLTAPVA